MSVPEWLRDALAWAVPSGVTGLGGWFLGARKRKADAALTEAKAATEHVNALGKVVEVLERTMERQGGEIVELRHTVTLMQGREQATARYIDRAWQFYDAGARQPFPESLPGNRPPEVLAIIRPHELKDIVKEEGS